MIIFIDHIGLVKVKGKSAYDRATEVAKELRSMCLDYNCTIVALSQLNRITDKQGNKPDKPNLSMLRDSGELEQSARKVAFVWELDNDYWIFIEKNDSAPKSKVRLKYIKDTQKMMEDE